MAVFTIPSISKGAASTISLNKNDLLALASVAADPYYSVSTNIKTVIVEWNSDPGNQKERLRFDFEQASPQASFLVSEKARDSFLLESITLVDFDGGQFLITGASLPTGFDISLGGGGGGLPVTDGLYSWFKADALSLSQGASVTLWSDESGSVGSANMVQDGAIAAPTYQASAINSLPAVRNSASAVLKMARAFPANSSTIFIVAKGAVGASVRGALYSEQNNVGGGATALALTHKADNAGKPLWGYYSSPFAQPELTPAVGENPFICATVAEYNVSIQQYLNGSLASTVSGAAMAGTRASSVYLFNFFSWYFQGDIAEFVIYNRVLTTQERADVTAYLGTKYAITVS